MKKSSFSDIKILSILKQAESGLLDAKILNTTNRYAKCKLGFTPTQEGLITTLKIFFI